MHVGLQPVLACTAAVPWQRRLAIAANNAAAQSNQTALCLSFRAIQAIQDSIVAR